MIAAVEEKLTAIGAGSIEAGRRHVIARRGRGESNK